MHDNEANPSVRGGASSCRVTLYVRPVCSAADGEALFDRALATLQAHSKGYPWNASFGLGEPRLWQRHARGTFLTSLRYGDNVTDEWFIVHLLLRLTKEYPDVIARVSDSDDGEFLLVEAADHLPAWVESEEDAAGRVFIFQGQLRLVPSPHNVQAPVLLPAAGSLLADPEGMEQAIKVVMDSHIGPQLTRVPPAVETTILSRLREFGSGAEERNSCHVQLLVPTRVAAVLQTCPVALSRAVNCLCDRDGVEMRQSEKLGTFAPPGKQAQLVSVRTVLSKFMMGRLVSQRVSLSKVLGPWPDDQSPEFAQRVLGDRITLGMEIAYNSCRSSVWTREHRPNESGSPGKNSAAWRDYIQLLTQRGFFGPEMVGSRRWQELENVAYARFQEQSGTGVIAGLYKSIEDTEDALFLGACDRAMRKSDVFKHEGQASGSGETQQTPLKEYVGNHSRDHEDDDLVANETMLGMQSFLSGSSTMHGVEVQPVNDPISLDPEAFFKIASKAVGEQQEPTDDESSEGANSESDPDWDVCLQGLGKQMESLMASVMEEMDQELSVKGVSLEQTMIGRSDGDISEKSSELAADKKFEAAENPLPESPLDVDFNLIESLVASVEAQEQRPGPASNILGSLGVKLPR